MVDLRRVTLVTIATRDHNNALVALKSCTNKAKFAGVVVFTNICITEFPATSEFRIEPRHYTQWCVWRMTELPKFCESFADFILFIESDSRLINPEAWTDEFFGYDYIGAPWHDRVVGNGGFTLMSQKFLDSLSKIKLPAEPWACHPCDWKICRDYRSRMENLGCKYADYTTANRFSNETGDYQGAFGVHGKQILQILKNKGKLRE